MFNKLREKAHVFWLRHRGAIIGFGVFAIGTVGIGMAVNNYAEKKEAERAAAEEETRKKADEEAERLAEQERAEETDPTNQLKCGGYIVPRNDWFNDPDYPGGLANTVPISAMGEFGKEMLDRVNESWFGEFSEAEGFKPETATVDVMIDFGHEVWKYRNPADSQEKQAS